MTDTELRDSTVSIASPDVGQAELRRIQAVLGSGQLSGGDEVDAFGAEFADYCGVDHGVPTTNGTTALHAIADRNDAVLIEDCAQAHGATYRGDPVGSFGAAGCFSFYPTKNMTTGEGGMVVTDDDDVAHRLRSFIDHGRSPDGGYEQLGHNFRMTDICAAVGRVQLGKLDDFVAARRAHAAEFDAVLRGSRLRPPAEPDGTHHAYHQYTVACDDRDELRSHLADHGVDSAVYYPTPIHEQPPYDDVTASLPVAERAARDVLSIPVHPDLTSRDVRAIRLALAEYTA